MRHELQTLADPDPDAVAQAGDTTIRPGRVVAAASLAMADRAAS